MSTLDLLSTPESADISSGDSGGGGASVNLTPSTFLTPAQADELMAALLTNTVETTPHLDVWLARTYPRAMATQEGVAALIASLRNSAGVSVSMPGFPVDESHRLTLQLDTSARDTTRCLVQNVLSHTLAAMAALTRSGVSEGHPVLVSLIDAAQLLLNQAGEHQAELRGASPADYRRRIAAGQHPQPAWTTVVPTMKPQRSAMHDQENDVQRWAADVRPAAAAAVGWVDYRWSIAAGEHPQQASINTAVVGHGKCTTPPAIKPQCDAVQDQENAQRWPDEGLWMAQTPLSILPHNGAEGEAFAAQHSSAPPANNACAVPPDQLCSPSAQIQSPTDTSLFLVRTMAPVSPMSVAADERVSRSDAVPDSPPQPSLRPSLSGRRVLRDPPMSPATMSAVTDVPTIALVAFGVRAEWFALDPFAPQPSIGACVVVPGDRGNDVGFVVGYGAADGGFCDFKWRSQLPLWRLPFAAPRKPKEAPRSTIVRLATVIEAATAHHLLSIDPQLVARVQAIVEDYTAGNASFASFRVQAVETQYDKLKTTVYFSADVTLRIAAVAVRLFHEFRCRIFLQQVNP